MQMNLVCLISSNFLFRFCGECKNKVMRAYHLMVGEVDPKEEKGYCASLYEGIRKCPHERHLHLVCDTAYIGGLISRAEPDLNCM